MTSEINDNKDIVMPEEFEGEAKVVMVDEETGEEFQFLMVDDFEFEDDVYCVLMTDDEEEEAVIVRVVENNGEDIKFASIDEDSDYERVLVAYEKILDEMDFDDEEGN